jgi:hypothetical protein
MSSDLRKTILNTRERWTSTKYNDQVAIHDRNLQEAVRALTSADEDLSGVISGLIASVNSGTFDITIGRGLALLFDAAKVAPDSEFRWIEIESSIVGTVPAADPGNPRWDVIEISPGVASTGLVSRDIFDPTLGTFTSQSVNVQEISAPVVQVRSGTAAANPALPAGATGQIPLAYVLVPAAAGSIPDDNLIHCRPILRPPGACDAGSDVLFGLEERMIRGGGIEVDANGLVVRTMDTFGRFDRSRLRFGISQGGSITLQGDNIDGGSLPGADDVIYWYAVPVPYPSGYDGTVAPREFHPQTGAVAQFATAFDGIQGCIIVASTLRPEVDEMQGQVATGGTGSIDDPPFGGGASSARAGWVYLGATWFDFSDTELEAQEVNGPNVVVVGGEKTEISFLGDDVTVTPGFEVTAWNSRAPGANSELEFPVTALLIHSCFRSDLVIASGDVTGRILDRRAGPNTGVNATCVVEFERATTTAASQEESIAVTLMPAKGTGNIRLDSIDLNSGDSFRFELTHTAYEDCILARR